MGKAHPRLAASNMFLNLQHYACDCLINLKLFLVPPNDFLF